MRGGCAAGPERRSTVGEKIAGEKREEYGQHAERHELGLAAGVAREVGGGETGGVYEIVPERRSQGGM